MADLADGALPALPVTPFPLNEASAAFRHMMKARQIGKIVVSHQRTVPAPLTRPDGQYSSLAAYPAWDWRWRNGLSRAARNIFRWSDVGAPIAPMHQPSYGD